MHKNNILAYLSAHLPTLSVHYSRVDLLQCTLCTCHIFQMHNLFLWSFTVLPERRKGRGGGSGGCEDEVLHESVPGPRPHHEDTETRTTSCPQPFFLSLYFFIFYFFIVGGEHPVTLSWKGKHEVSSNVLQLNTVKIKKATQVQALF